MTNLTTFKAGKTYKMLFIGDSELIVPISIAKRTKKTATIIYDGKAKRVKIHTDDVGEYIYPTGRYSMCPRAHSKRIID